MTHPTRLRKRFKAVSRIVCGLSWIGVASLTLIAVPAWAEEDSSPCQGSLDALSAAYANDPATRVAFQLTYDGLKQPLPAGYTYDGSSENPWAKSNKDGADLVASVLSFYEQVCTLLPSTAAAASPVS